MTVQGTTQHFRGVTQPAAFHVDIAHLAQTDPALAQAGRAANEIGSPADLDGNPNILRGDELLTASAFLSGPDFNRLARHATNHVPRASNSVVKDGVERVLNPAVWQALGVDIPPPEHVKPGQVTAYGGYCLTKQAGSTALLTLGVQFPIETEWQSLDASSLKLRVVNNAGHDVDCVANVHIVGDKTVRRQLRVTVDLDKLPPQAYLRWEVVADLKARPEAQLATPVLLPLRGLPPQTRRFLAPEPNILTTHPFIKQAAWDVRSRSLTLQDLVANTQQLLASVRDRVNKSETYRTDALGFLLGANGACDSNANLFAAIMRANGVPCRPIAGILRGASQETHYQNEYFVPGQGWVHVEPQDTTAIQEPRWKMVQFGHVNPWSQLDPQISWMPSVLTRPNWVDEFDDRGRRLSSLSPARKLAVDYGLFVGNGALVPGLMGHAA